MRPQGTGRPTLAQKAFQSEEYCLDIQSVNCAVDPEPSDRVTGTIALFGIASPGLSFWICGRSSW